MSNGSDYRLRIVKRYTRDVDERLVQADTAVAAVRLAAEIAAELDADDFTVTELPPKIRR